MQCCVLGPLHIVTERGEVRRPKGEKQRVLLATLLLHAPRVASADRLVQTLWGDQPPNDPAAALRTQISRLRAMLADGAADHHPLRSEPHGYRLAVDVQDVDAGRFDALQRAARDTASASRSLALLDEGLALWRGEPFEECTDLPPFLGEIVRLKELRTGAAEQRIECLLALGRTSEALAAAEVLVHADPLRERPRALCMEALHRAGRAHEALSLFQAFRRLLAEELGLDPSPALRDLEARILRHRGPATHSPDAPGTLAPLSARSRLPAPLTRMIGRANEQASILRLLQSTRLLTLTGAGGSGKTRLALAVSHQLQENAADTLIWAPLDATADPAFVAHEVAAAAGAREHPGRSAIETLCELFARREIFVVLDNCEHVLDACASLVEAVLGACPGVSVMATSREPLGITGEVTLPVPPLRVPDADARLAALGRYESVQLFVERARAAVPAFELTEENASAVARICRQLDGIPLALELAAARVRVLSPMEISTRLEDSLELLSGGSRSTLARHQTLPAAIDWSYQLLPHPERILLERLSVFSGGFSLDAVEAVCSDDHVVERARVLDVLSGLVAKSLVIANPRDGGTRYRLLEVVRSCARERLGVRGEDTSFRRRHAEHFAAVAEHAEPLLLSPRRADTGRRLLGDYENVRAALAWAVSDPRENETAYRLVGSLWWFWHYVGRFGEARHWAEATLALSTSNVPRRLRARALYTAAMACWLVGDPVAAQPYGEESTRIARELAEPSLLVRAISAYAFALRDVGELERAKRLASECVAVARRAGFPPTEMGFALWIQCTALLDAGDVGPAETAAKEAEMLWRATGDRWGLSMVLHGLAMARLGVGELDEAAGHFREAVELLRGDGEPYFITRCIEGLAIVRVHQGRADAASRLFGAAEAIRATIEAPLLGFEEARYRRTVEILVPLLESQKRAEAWAQGRAMTLDEAIGYALGDG